MSFSFSHGKEWLSASTPLWRSPNWNWTYFVDVSFAEGSRDFQFTKISISCKFEKLTRKPFLLFLLSSLNSSFCSNLVAGEKTGLAFLASDWCCLIKSIIIYHCISMIAGVWNNIHPIRFVPNLDFKVQLGIASADWIWTQAWLAAGFEPGSFESSDQHQLQSLSLPY